MHATTTTAASSHPSAPAALVYGGERLRRREHGRASQHSKPGLLERLHRDCALPAGAHVAVVVCRYRKRDGYVYAPIDVRRRGLGGRALLTDALETTLARELAHLGAIQSGQGVHVAVHLMPERAAVVPGAVTLVTAPGPGDVCPDAVVSVWVHAAGVDCGEIAAGGGGGSGGVVARLVYCLWERAVQPVHTGAPWSWRLRGDDDDETRPACAIHAVV